MSVRSRPASRRSRWPARALALAALAFAGRASADDLVAALWLHPGVQDDRLSQRVRGQVSDLPVRLVEAQDAGLSASIGEQLDAADGIARRSGARVVVWFAPLDPRSPRAGLLVVVAEAARGRVLIRRVESTAPPTAGPAEVDSATLEAAALIVRTALRGLAEGAVIGLDRTEIAPAPAPTTSPTPTPPKRPPSIPPPPRLAAKGTWIAAVGWRATFDGQALQQGLAGRLGHVVGPWTAGLAVAPSLGADLVDSRATLRLARHAFGAFGERAILETTQLSLGAGLTTGVVLFPRSTSGPARGIVPTGSALNPAFFAGLEARARWFPPWLGGFLGVGIDAGVDAVPAAPTFGYAVDGRFVPTRSLAWAQPGGAIGVIARTP